MAEEGIDLSNTTEEVEAQATDEPQQINETEGGDPLSTDSAATAEPVSEQASESEPNESTKEEEQVETIAEVSDEPLIKEESES